MTEKYCALVSEDEIAKAREVLTEQKHRVQEMLNFCKLFLENIDNTSLAKLQNRAIYHFLETKIKKKKKKHYQKVPWDLNTYQKVLSLRPVHLTLRWNSTKAFKWPQDTEKGEIFAGQIEEQAKR